MIRLPVCALAALGMFVAFSTATAQFDQVQRLEQRIRGPRAVPARQAADPFRGGADPFSDDATPAASTEEPAAAEENADDEAAVTTEAAAPVSPRAIRMNLLDGSIITGELSVDEITVETEFGPLTVPVANIRSIVPGLDSSTGTASQIEKQIEDLGSDDYQVREKAHKDLVKWGTRIRGELTRYTNDDNAERKRHITEILKEFDELAEDYDEFDEGQRPREWIRGDTVVTTEFTIVGRVAQSSFDVASKYGTLTVKLADIRSADRPTGSKPEIRRNVNVDGNSLAQRGFKSSGIRVEAGDKISITAEGQVVMSPWGSNQSSTPDGAANFGWYIPNEIPTGALVAQIGNSGKIFKVGSKHTFTATKSGTLNFAVAMQNEYSQNGYAFPGQYRVRIKVNPK